MPLTMKDYDNIQKHPMTPEAFEREYLSYLKALQESNDVTDFFKISGQLEMIFVAMLAHIKIFSGCSTDDLKEGIAVFANDILKRMKYIEDGIKEEHSIN